MCKLFQIQTPNVIEYLVNTNIYKLTAPTPEVPGPETNIQNISINLKNKTQIILITGMIPIQIPVAYFTDAGYILMFVKIYNNDYSQSKPIFKVGQTLLSTNYAVVISNTAEPVNFQFLDLVNPISTDKVRNYSIKTQLISTIPIVDSQVTTISSPKVYTSILVQQIS